MPQISKGNCIKLKLVNISHNNKPIIFLETYKILSASKKLFCFILQAHTHTHTHRHKNTFLFLCYFLTCKPLICHWVACY